MPEVEHDMMLTDRAVATIKISEDQLRAQRKRKAPLDYSHYVYTDLLTKARPESLKIVKLPPALTDGFAISKCNRTRPCSRSPPWQ
jgi:hypothetical protein